MEEITKEKIDWLKEIANIQKIPEDVIIKMYKTYWISPLRSKLPESESWEGYCDNCLATFVQEWHREHFKR